MVSVWDGWKPGSGKQHDPKDTHFNPMYPPKGYPKELLERMWADDTKEELDGSKDNKENRRDS